jgi:hypothetical protein
MASDDLLQPTLRKADDLAGIHAPWTPSILVYLALLCGPLGGGALIALNYGRLGMPERVGRTFLVFVVLALVAGVGVALLVAGGTVDRQDRNQMRLVRFGANLLAVVVAGMLARGQNRRFDLWIAHGNKAASLWGPGLLAFVLGNLATFVLVLLLATILR